jgi:hypothetical protein
MKKTFRAMEYFDFNLCKTQQVYRDRVRHHEYAEVPGAGDAALWMIGR